MRVGELVEELGLEGAIDAIPEPSTAIFPRVYVLRCHDAGRFFREGVGDGDRKGGSEGAEHVDCSGNLERCKIGRSSRIGGRLRH